MPIDVLMPALSPTMTEGNLAKWHVKEGDSVSSGDVIAEIETDKATMEVEAVDEGIVGKLMVAEGTEGVAVNTPIAIIVGGWRGCLATLASAAAGRRHPNRQMPPQTPVAEVAQARCRAQSAGAGAAPCQHQPGGEHARDGTAPISRMAPKRLI